MKQANNPYELWKDMPEFIQNKQEPYSKITIRFENENDLEEFAKLINQKLTNKTKSIWFPYKSHFRNEKKEWCYEPAVSNIHTI